MLAGVSIYLALSGLMMLLFFLSPRALPWANLFHPLGVRMSYPQ